MKNYRIVIYCLILIIIGLVGLFGGWVYSPEYVADKRALLIPFFTVCSGLISTSLVIILFDLNLKRELHKDQQDKFIKSVNENVRTAMALGSRGLKAVYHELPDEKIKLAAVHGTKLLILNTYAPNLQTLKTAIISTLEKGGEVRVALLAIDSPFIDLRYKEIHRTKEEFIGGINGNISRLERFRAEAETKEQGKLWLGQYDGAPGISLYASGNLMWVGSYLAAEDAVNSPQFEIEAGSKIYKKYLDHFEEIWSRCKVTEILSK